MIKREVKFRVGDLTFSTWAEARKAETRVAQRQRLDDFINKHFPGGVVASINRADILITLGEHFVELQAVFKSTRKPKPEGDNE